MEEQNSGKKRKRVGGPRTTTGCPTCRVRHVKCDEKRPACFKCTSTGRKCEGYSTTASRCSTTAVVSTAGPSQTKPPYLASKTYSIPFHVPGSQKDRQLLHYFCVHGASELAGFLDQEFWTRTVLQACHEEAVVRNALVALSSIHKQYLAEGLTPDALQAKGGGELDHLILYKRAIGQLRKYISPPAEPSPKVVLICSALLYCFENTRGDYEAAMRHLENGLEILQGERQRGRVPTGTARSAPGSSRSSSSSSETHSKSVGDDKAASGDETSNKANQAETFSNLLQLFARLDLQATFFNQVRVPKLNLKSESVQFSGSGHRVLDFENLADAQWALDILQNRLFCFLIPNMPFKYTPPEELPGHVLWGKIDLNVDFDLWEAEMDKLVARMGLFGNYSTATVLNKSRPVEKENYANTLRMHFRISEMLLRSNFPDDPSVFGASPNPDAEEIVGLAERLNRARGNLSENVPKDTRTFSSAVGIIPPVFLVAMRCRDLSLRRRALAQLAACQGRKEGFYDASVTYGICEKIEAREDEERAERYKLEGVGLALEFVGLDVVDESRGLGELARMLDVSG